MTRQLSSTIGDEDVSVLVPANAAVVVSFDDEVAHDFSILTYWHQPEDGTPGYVVVEIEDLSAAGPDADTPPTPVKVRHNEGVVYDWRISEDALPERPRTTCGCGHVLVWVHGEWEHDDAPSIWGDDHEPRVAPPAYTAARKYWDAEDKVCCDHCGSSSEAPDPTCSQCPPTERVACYAGQCTHIASNDDELDEHNKVCGYQKKNPEGRPCPACGGSCIPPVCDYPGLPPVATKYPSEEEGD